MQPDFADDLSLLKTLDLGLDEFAARYRNILRFERSGADFSLEFREPLREADLPSQTVTSGDVKVALSKCIDGLVTPDELQAWANFLLLLDAYEFEPGEAAGNVVSSVLHLVATPEINEKLTDATLRYYVQCLDANQEPSL